MPQASGEPGSVAVRVLGPVEVTGVHDGTPVVPRGARSAALLVALALADGGPVPVPELVDLLWPDAAPADPRAALHSLVSRLRRDAGDVMRSLPGGYALTARSDLTIARDAAVAARQALVSGRPDDAARTAATALALWRGGPGDDLDDGPVRGDLRVTALRLHAELTAARRDAAQALDDHATVVGLASTALAADPLDEDAARALMTAYAAQGRPAEAARVFGRLRHALVAELGADPAPDLVALHDRLLADQPALPPALPPAPQPAPLPALPPAPGGPAVAPASVPGPWPAGGQDGARVALGLRAAPNTLLGRDGDVAAVEAALVTSRLVTVLGAGGLGKTRLALEVARRAAATTPLVVVVELAGVRADDDVVLALADALGLAANQSARLSERLLAGDLHHQVVARLRGAASLVVLDNCEHVAAGAARWVSDLLDHVPGLRILATSRSPLRLTAEQSYPLAPLTAPGPAVELFVQRARAARPDAALPGDVVARLCERLDGLPLAIELAAARVRTMSVAQIEDHLSERFALLRSGDATAPDRHRTLEAVIDWSWNLLTDAQRALWRRAALLPDGFGPDAAAAIGRLGTGTLIDALDDVDGLVTQSLLSVTDTGGVARYRMLETVREFGLLRLAEAGEELATRDALLDWAAGLARRHVAALLGPGQVAAIAELTRDQENLLFALRTAAVPAVDRRGVRRPEVVVQVFVGLAASWAMRGSEERAAGPAVAVLDALRGWPVPDEDVDATAVALLFTIGTLVGGEGRSPARPLARLRLLARRGGLGSRTRALVELAGLPDRAAIGDRLAGLRDDPDPLLAFAARLGAGQEAENEGHLEEALRDAEAAYECATRIGDVACPAFAAMFVASTASELGDFATAVRWLDRVRPGFTALGATGALRQLDWIELSAALDVGDIATAATLCDRLEAPGGEPEGRNGVEMRAVAGAARAEIALARGDVGEGLAHYATAVGMFDDGPGPSAPWAVMLGAARLVRLVGPAGGAQADEAGEVDHAGEVDEAGEADEAAASLCRRAVATYRDWMPQFLDRPVLGTACLAVASWLMRLAERGEDAAELFALAEALGSRQDLAPLRREPLLAAATARLGAARLAAARARLAALSREDATQRAFALLDAVAGQGERGPVPQTFFM